jgi:hypothetical protein
MCVSLHAHPLVLFPLSLSLSAGQTDIYFFIRHWPPALCSLAFFYLSRSLAALPNWLPALCKNNKKVLKRLRKINKRFGEDDSLSLGVRESLERCTNTSPYIACSFKRFACARVFYSFCKNIVLLSALFWSDKFNVLL